MSSNSDFTIIKEKKVDKSTTLTIKKNIMSGRIFVEFVSKNPRLVLQKNFQDTLDGKRESDKFSKSIRNTQQLKEYFGIKNET